MLFCCLCLLLLSAAAQQQHRGLRSYLNPNGTELSVGYSDVLPPHLFVSTWESVDSFAARLGEREANGLGNTAYHPIPSSSCSFPHNIINHLLSAIPELKHSADKIIGAEYWVQIRDPSDPLMLHFDSALQFQEKNYQIITPVLSSILYLTEGGSTAIFDTRQRNCPPSAALNGSAACERLSMDQSLSPPKLGPAALVPAQPNRYALFDGSLLHGVLPSEQDDDSVRATLLFNWWTTDPLVSPEEENVGLPDKDRRCPPPAHPPREPKRVQHEAVAAEAMEDLARLELRLPLRLGAGKDGSSASIDINVPAPSRSSNIKLTDYAGAENWRTLSEAGNDDPVAALFPGGAVNRRTEVNNEL